ncbi:hypothetical protein QKW60_02575 [Defluviimonas aestuarii]|uniref:hypothetical protein n=1 Tax=Albidovulum aestuarii TaxID=1130726 RepID=UPI00249B7555|nr:hypothetical protein [Defluviimonas aestuarii]MDI3335279.1 hypothetical protein [Defluviimonas aestuarii]
MDVDVAKLFWAIVSAGGGGAVVAYYVFRHFGETWLDSKFSQKLEMFRHSNAKDLEKLRAEIDGSLKAQVRLQERQFESLRDIWDSLKDAQTKIVASLSPLQSYADLRKMDNDAREEYMDSFALQAWQKKEVLGSTNIQEAFTAMIDRLRLSEAIAAFTKFDALVRRNELFFPEEIYSKLRDVADAMHSSLVDKDIALESKDRKMSLTAWNTYDKKCNVGVSEFVGIARKLLGS